MILHRQVGCLKKTFKVFKQMILKKLTDITRGLERRLFILAEPRSGSSWLAETLNSHPRIHLQGELLNQTTFPLVENFRGRDAFPACLKYLESRFQKGPEQNGDFEGCKILLTQLFQVDHGFTEVFLRHFQGAHYLFLTRKNLVAALVSLKIANANNVWHLKDEAARLYKVTIDPGFLIKNMEQTQYRRRLVHDLLVGLGIKFYPLAYETMFAAPEKTPADICRFLDLTPTGMRFSREQKGNPYPFEQTILNYEALREGLSPYPEYLQMLLHREIF